MLYIGQKQVVKIHIGTFNILYSNVFICDKYILTCTEKVPVWGLISLGFFRKSFSEEPYNMYFSLVYISIWETNPKVSI